MEVCCLKKAANSKILMKNKGIIILGVETDSG
jgi:hypothetical protein